MEHFDQMAKGYDTEVRLNRAKVVADEIRKHVKIAGASAMEYGCGTGLVGMNLLDCFGNLLFVDVSAPMIEQVQQKIDGQNIKNAGALCCDLLNDEPPAQKFDYIFLSLVLHHIMDTAAILAKFRDLLNDGGHLLVIDLDKDEGGGFHAKHPHHQVYHGYEQGEICEAVRSAGFSGVSIKTFYQDEKEHNERRSPYSLFILDGVK